MSTDKTKKEILREAQEEAQAEVVKQRLALLQALHDLHDLGLHEDYENSILKIVGNAGSDGILLTDLQEVLPKSKPFAEACENLVNRNELNRNKAGTTSRLSLSSQAQAN